MNIETIAEKLYEDLGMGHRSDFRHDHAIQLIRSSIEKAVNGIIHKLPHGSVWKRAETPTDRGEWKGICCCIHLPDGAIVCVGNGVKASTLRKYHNGK